MHHTAQIIDFRPRRVAQLPHHGHRVMRDGWLISTVLLADEAWTRVERDGASLHFPGRLSTIDAVACAEQRTHH